MNINLPFQMSLGVVHLSKTAVWNNPTTTDDVTESATNDVSRSKTNDVTRSTSNYATKSATDDVSKSATDYTPAK
jgi:hypothetical protein